MSPAEGLRLQSKLVPRLPSVSGCGADVHLTVVCFLLSPKNLTYEIILTLGQAFEVAYQLALQAQRAKPLGAAAGETIETKSSKPVPKPRAGVRKSAVRMRKCRLRGPSWGFSWAQLA